MADWVSKMGAVAVSQYANVVEYSTKTAMFSRFAGSRAGDAFVITIPLTIRSSVLLVAEAIVEILTKAGEKPVIRSEYAGYLAVLSENIVVIIEDDNRKGAPASYNSPQPAENAKTKVDLFTPALGVYDVDACGDREMLYTLITGLKAVYKNERFAQIKWWYHEDGQGTTHKTTYLEPPKTVILPEFYPNIANPATYIKDYLASDAAILLMAGPPGTGKTTLLRHMIYEHNLTASVVYDEALMERDTIFQQFLFGDEDDILIIEDADVILTAREASNNRLMSRFLNISDGLIKLPNKKLVFTTNISDFNRVDQALMRSGRCFDVLHTRELTISEATAAATAANLPVPTEQREYTVAQLFNQSRKTTPLRRVGFT